MNKYIDTLDSISEKLSNILHYIAVIAMVFWPFVMVIYVILRYFGINWLFVEEYTRYWQVLIVFFALAYTLRKNKHIKVNLLVDTLPQKTKEVIKLIVLFLIFFTISYLINKSLDFTKYGIMSQVKSTTTQLIIWPIYLLIPIGLISFNLEVFLQIIKGLRAYFCNKSHNKIVERNKL